MRTSTRVGLFGLAMVVALAGGARAGEDSSRLQCWSHTGDGAWATQILTTETTSVGSGTETEHNLGFVFADDADQQIMCSWLVPSDYDSSAVDPPYLSLAGWSRDTDGCFSSCPGSRYVRLLAASRRYGNDMTLNAAWGSDTEQILTFAGEGVSPVLYKADKLKIAEGISATADSSDWTPHDLIFFRIQRDKDVTNNLGQEFYLAEVRIHYFN